MAGNTGAGASQTNGTADTVHVNGSAMNPYETDPERVPKDDPYISRSPDYGRYTPRDDDFNPRYDRWHEPEPEATAYWEDIVRKSCVPENSLNVPGSREAFSAGRVVIKVDNENVDDGSAEVYSCVNANELSSARKVEDVLKAIGVAVPVIYFCGTVDGKNVIVESRIPGVSLEVAWRYLTAGQISTIKQQCRRIIQRLAEVERASNGPSYVCSGLNSQSQPDMPEQEKKILFKEKGEDDHLCLVHNDMVRPNIIVKDDRVVGVAGWRQCGLFGLDRAAKVHRALRIPEITYVSGTKDSSEGAMAWDDLYDDLSEDSVKNQDALEPQVKTEPTNMSLDKVPDSEDTETKAALAQVDGADLPDEHPTPKKIADLKHGLASRASSSDRSSPANSVKGAATGKKSVGGSKKGTAKKPTTTTKKRKADDEDGDSVDGGRRSNTPSSRTSKTPAPKKQGSASAAGSPAPEPKKKGRKRAPKQNDDDDDDENAVFCICRRPDNHTWMIACDGVCDDWYHGKCVNIDPRDAELIDKYICKFSISPPSLSCIVSLTCLLGPNCHGKGRGHTSWKPMCRLPECRKPARVTRKAPSKYCSDEHGREFMRRRAQNFAFRKADNAKAPDGIGSRGGIVTAGELKAAIMGVSSAEEFRRLGERIISPPPEEAEEEEGEKPDEKPATDAQAPKNETTTKKKEKKLGLDVDAKGLVYTPDEAAKIQKLRQQRAELLHRQEMLKARDSFVNIVRQRSRTILERLKQTDPKGGWKDICGFDSRVAWSDEEFDEWRLSPAGEKSMKDGTLDPIPAAGNTDADGDTVMDGNKNNNDGQNKNDEDDGDDITTLARGVCTKKRCERHKQWVKVHQEDILFEENTTEKDLKKCEEEAQTVVERAMLRMWAEMDNAHVEES